MNRRQFLRFTAAISIALCITRIDWLFEEGQASALADPSLLRILGDRCVRDIGSSYRDQFPREDDPIAISSAIATNSGIFRDQSLCESQILLKQQIQNDFARGSTIRINGWVLSLTEARHCALFSMLDS